MSSQKADVVMAGGGFAGLALALRQGLGESFRIVVADPAFAPGAKPDLRASAIAAETMNAVKDILGFIRH